MPVMDFPTRMRRTAKWSVFTTALTIAFWGIWYAVAGNVPEVRLDWLHTDHPLHISRWWDIAQCPVWVYLILRFRGDARLAELHKKLAQLVDMPLVTACTCPAILVVLPIFITHGIERDPIRYVLLATGAGQVLLTALFLGGEAGGAPDSGEKYRRYFVIMGYGVIGGAVSGTLAGFPVGFLYASAVTASATLLYLLPSTMLPACRAVMRWLND